MPQTNSQNLITEISNVVQTMIGHKSDAGFWQSSLEIKTYFGGTKIQTFLHIIPLIQSWQDRKLQTHLKLWWWKHPHFDETLI